MPQQRAHREQSSGSPLQGVLLALLLAEPDRALHGYRLTTLARRRLGPAWEVTRQSVYRALARLESEGLVAASVRPGAAQGGAGHGHRVFMATDSAEAALAAWMAGPIGKEPLRVELQAKIAVSRPDDAPSLLQALDAYERSCFEMLRATNEAEVPMGSWAGLSMNLTRTAVDENIQAELRWVTIARRWIEDFIAERASGSAR